MKCVSTARHTSMAVVVATIVAGCGVSGIVDGGFDSSFDGRADARVAPDSAVDAPSPDDASVDAMSVSDSAVDATSDAPNIDAGRDAVSPDAIADDTGMLDATASDAGLIDAGADAGAPALCPGTPPVTEPPEQVFVAPGGSDTAAGTAAAPLATLGAAARHFPMGGTVIVRGGTYRPQSVPARGLAGHPLFIRAAAGEVPVFDGATVTGMYGTVISLTAASHVVLQGLEIRNCHAAQCSAIQGGPVLDLAIVNCHLHDLDGTAARFAGSTIRFEGNHIHDVALTNLNNVAYPNGGWPTCMGTLPNNATPTTPQANGVVIRNNVIENCWGEGIGVWFATNALVEGNVVENPFSVGIYMDNSSNVTVTRNFVHVTRGARGSRGTGIELATEHYSSWTLFPTSDVSITDNVVVGGQGIWWWKSPETTAANTYRRLDVTHNTAVATAGPALAFQAVSAGTPTPTGCTARNNVFAETSAASIGNAPGWTLASNAWLNGPRPGIAGATDVTITATLGTVSMATDVEPLASVVGNGAAGTGVTIDYACNPRDTTAPRRGAYER